MCLNKILFRGLCFFLFKISFFTNGCNIQAIVFLFVGSCKVFPYEWLHEKGSINRNLTDGAFLSWIMCSASSFGEDLLDSQPHLGNRMWGVCEVGLGGLSPLALVLHPRVSFVPHQVLYIHSWEYGQVWQGFLFYLGTHTLFMLLQMQTLIR